jgi:hypothetical protein
MNRRLLSFVPVVAVFAIVAAGAGAAATPTTTECKDIKQCIDVTGPWVIVPAHGEATYLLQCPKQKSGTVGGVDALATSSDVRVTFDGLLGGPVAAGTTTRNEVYFRAVSAGGHEGAFEPRIGCIPSSASGGRETTSARPTLTGQATALVATNLRLAAGSVQLAKVGCPAGTHVLSSWNATAFRTANPPDVGLAAAIHVQQIDAARSSSGRVSTSETLPPGSNAEVQLGVVCAG